MIQKKIFVVVIVTLLLTACRGNKLDVDVSNVSFTTTYVDLDAVIFHADSSELMNEHHRFPKELGELYEYYMGYCMQIGPVSDSLFYESILAYRKDSFIVQLENEISKTFKDKTGYENIIIDGFKHLKHHYPKGPFPEKIVWMNSLFMSNVWCSEKSIGIGMERYLGYQSPSIKRLPDSFYDWVRRGMDAKFLEVDVMTGWIETNIIKESDGNLVEDIVRWGKILYLVQAAYPNMPDYTVLRYDQKQLDWAKSNEYAFWKYLVDEKMLFENNDRNKMNFLNPGPTTPGLPAEGAPDRLGRFLGWRMVKQFMERTDTKVSDLIDIPYNEILQEFEIE